MKKWMYVLGPGIMLAVFMFFYLASKEETEARLKAEKAHKEEVAKEAEQKKQLADLNDLKQQLNAALSELKANQAIVAQR